MLKFVVVVVLFLPDDVPDELQVEEDVVQHFYAQLDVLTSGRIC